MKHKKIFLFFVFYSFVNFAFSASRNMEFFPQTNIFSRPAKLKTEKGDCFLFIKGVDDKKRNDILPFCLKMETKKIEEIKNFPYAPMHFISSQEKNLLIGFDYNGNWWGSRINENFELIFNKKIENFFTISNILACKEGYFVYGVSKEKNIKFVILNKAFTVKYSLELKDVKFKNPFMSVIEVNSEHIKLKLNDFGEAAHLVDLNWNLNVLSKNKSEEKMEQRFQIKDGYLSAYIENKKIFLERNSISEKWKKIIYDLANEKNSSFQLELAGEFVYLFNHKLKEINVKKISINSGDTIEEKSFDVGQHIDPELELIEAGNKLWLQGISSQEGETSIFSIEMN
jgi:hypothetical protein